MVCGVVSELNIDVMVDLSDWEILDKHGRALVNMIEACDLAVPLSLNFRVGWRGHRREETFRLPHRKDVASRHGRPVVLGVNTALCSG